MLIELVIRFLCISSLHIQLPYSVFISVVNGVYTIQKHFCDKICNILVAIAPLRFEKTVAGTHLWCEVQGKK